LTLLVKPSFAAIGADFVALETLDMMENNVLQKFDVCLLCH